jgi:hypothetical protein
LLMALGCQGCHGSLGVRIVPLLACQLALVTQLVHPPMAVVEMRPPVTVLLRVRRWCHQVQR